MSPALAAHLQAMSDGQRRRMATDSRKALRTAWDHRHGDARARLVVRSNVSMLRNLRSL